MVTRANSLVKVGENALVRNKASGWLLDAIRHVLDQVLSHPPLIWDEKNEGQEGVIIICWKMALGLSKG